jgi:hypothetical protein
VRHNTTITTVSKNTTSSDRPQDLKRIKIGPRRALQPGVAAAAAVYVFRRKIYFVAT